MGVVITATQIDTADAHPVSFQDHYVGQQSVVLLITPFFRFYRFYELIRTKFRETDACNQVGIAFPVGLDDKPYVVEKRHVCVGTARASGFLLPEESYFNGIVFFQAFQTDEYSVLVIRPRILKPSFARGIAENDVLCFYRLEILGVVAVCHLVDMADQAGIVFPRSFYHIKISVSVL